MTEQNSLASSQLELLEQLGHPRLLILGDLILDRYTWGDATRISPEAPVLVLQADRCEARLGGAASVACLARGLEADVAVAGIIGDDKDGREILDLFNKETIDRQAVVCVNARRTTVKERFIGRAAHRHPQQILRVDHEDCRPIRTELADQIAQSVASRLAGCDVLLLSDYDKGLCTPSLLASVIEAANRLQLPVIVDPARIADYSRYRGATLLTPNRAETQLATGMSLGCVEEALQAGRVLCDRAGVSAVIVTLDRDGMVLVTADGFTSVFPTQPRDVYDITGAGDMVLATLGVCMAAGMSLPDAVRLANVAAGLEVERVGVEPITRRDIRADIVATGRGGSGKVVTVEEMATLAESIRRRGQTIAFTNGCFDILHHGHAACLREAATLADVLVVGLNSDTSVRRLKGSGRPINSQSDRANLLAAMACVDYVVIFDDETPHELLQRIRPDVLVKGGTYTVEEVVGREVVETYGGRICVTGRVDGISTTQILAAATSGFQPAPPAATGGLIPAPPAATGGLIPAAPAGAKQQRG